MQDEVQNPNGLHHGNLILDGNKGSFVEAAPNKAKAPPKPQQHQPQQQDHPNPAGPNKATGSPKPKQPRTNQSSPEQSKSTTKTTAAPTTATGPPKPGSPDHSNRTTKPKQHQPQNRPSPTLAGRAASPHHRNLGKVRETVRRAVFGTGTPLLLHGAFDRESDRSGTIAMVQVVNAFHQHIALRAVPHV